MMVAAIGIKEFTSQATCLEGLLANHSADHRLVHVKPVHLFLHMPLGSKSAHLVVVKSPGINTTATTAYVSARERTAVFMFMHADAAPRPRTLYPQLLLPPSLHKY